MGVVEVRASEQRGHPCLLHISASSPLLRDSQRSQIYSLDGALQYHRCNKQTQKGYLISSTCCNSSLLLFLMQIENVSWSGFLKHLGMLERGQAARMGSHSLQLWHLIIYKLHFLIVKMRIIVHALHLIPGELIRRIMWNYVKALLKY